MESILSSLQVIFTVVFILLITALIFYVVAKNPFYSKFIQYRELTKKYHAEAEKQFAKKKDYKSAIKNMALDLQTIQNENSKNIKLVEEFRKMESMLLRYIPLETLNKILTGYLRITDIKFENIEHTTDDDFRIATNKIWQDSLAKKQKTEEKTDNGLNDIDVNNPELLSPDTIVFSEDRKKVLLHGEFYEDGEVAEILWPGQQEFKRERIIYVNNDWTIENAQMDDPLVAALEIKKVLFADAISAPTSTEDNLCPMSGKECETKACESNCFDAIAQTEKKYH